MDNTQQLQEDQYKFPYHYVPEWGNNMFTQVQAMRWGYEYASYVEFVVGLLEEMSPKKVIDIGCGDGRLVYEIRKNLPAVEVSGADYSAQAIGFAKAFSPSIEFYVGDITDPLFSIGTYDTVTLVETLEHIPPETIDGFVDGLSRLLESGGRLIVTVPHANVPVSKKHYQHFTLEHLEGMLSRHFTLENHHYTNTQAFGEKFIKRLFCNRLFCLNRNKITRLLYAYYKKKLFHSTENRAGRVIGVFVKK